MSKPLHLFHCLFFPATLIMSTALPGCDTPDQSKETEPAETTGSSEASATFTGSLVANAEELEKAIESAQPGDTIVMKNGRWEDVEIGFFAQGTKDKPIRLRAQEKGKVELVGQSNLRLAGEHLIVEGLVFKDGYSPTGQVISFAQRAGKYANHSRVTECVIDNFNNPRRVSVETWVTLFGKNNRIDHSTIADKRTMGVTMAVRLPDEASRENHHRIDHNYFGPRQTFGGNGGETLRIGTSHYSLSNSNTVVEENYFDRCDGELEIISSKSGGNKFIGNTFWESRGTLTFRHGNNSVAQDNFFFGNGKEHTGGIRLINERNKASNNYFYGMKGYRFRGALVVMNGVPNSPPHRYYQVVDGEMNNNTFINSDHIQLGAGKDAERTLPPKDTSMSNNFFFHEDKENIFTLYDSMDGLTLENNFVGPNNEGFRNEGFTSVDPQLKKNEHGVFVPTNPALKGVGSSLEKPRATRENTGAPFYKYEYPEIEFGTGKKIQVASGKDNALWEAVKKSAPGDTLVLSSGEYREPKNIFIKHPLSIMAAQDDEKPVLRPGRSALFIIKNGGALTLRGLEFTGEDAPDMAGNSIVQTSDSSMNKNYQLIVEDCYAHDLVVNRNYDFFRATEYTFADKITFKNSQFKNISGRGIALNKDIEHLGTYNAEYVTIEGCTFEDLHDTALNLYRGGTDESTFGPTLVIADSKFINVGNGKRNQTSSAVSLHGVQVADVHGSTFEKSPGLRFHTNNGQPLISVKNLTFTESPGVFSNYKDYESENIVKN